MVGRAELLSSIFYLWALMVYAKSIGTDRHIGLLCFLFQSSAMNVCLIVLAEGWGGSAMAPSVTYPPLILAMTLSLPKVGAC